MAMTLVEASKLSQDTMLPGVIETIAKESPVLSLLPFTEVVGNGLTYNRENAASTVSFEDVGDTWSEDTPTFTQVSASLKILGGDADVDNFLRQTRVDPNELAAEVLALKARAWAHKFETTFVYGDTTLDANSFDGILRMVPGGQSIAQGSGTSPGALSVANLDVLIDKVIPGKPDCLLMSRRTRRLLSAYMRSLGAHVPVQIDQFGHRVIAWDTVPIYTSDFITDTETVASGASTGPTGGTGSSVYAVRFGEGGLMGLRNGQLPTIEEFPHLETKDASRFRVKGYVGLALFSTLAVGRISGISGGAVVA